jgi:hypothetical protein
MTDKMCSTCKIIQPLDNFTKRASSKDGRTSQCRKCRAVFRAKPTSKEKINSTKRQYFKTYRKNPKVRISLICRADTREIVKNFNTIEHDTFIDLIQCTAKTFMEHLQTTAINNGYTDFNIYDYDSKTYHLDHIKPFKLFLSGDATLEEISHYTNVQILLWHENLTKGEHYDENIQ